MREVRSTVPPMCPKGPDSGAEVSLGVTWGVPRGALDIVAGQKPPTSSGEPGSLRGVLDDSGMKPTVRVSFDERKPDW